MLGLAIDSAGARASAALWRSRDGGASADLVREGALSPEAGKADQLVLVIEELLRHDGLSYAELDVLAVNRGPGSFTGIRSAVALARGLALAAGLTVIGVTSHDVVAAMSRLVQEREHAGRPLMVVRDARRGQVYAQAFAPDGRSSSEIEARDPAAVAADLMTGGWSLAGDGAGLVTEALSGEADVLPIRTSPIDAAAVAAAAMGQVTAGRMPGPGFDLHPLYVRAPDAAPPTPLIPTSALSEAAV